MWCWPNMATWVREIMSSCEAAGVPLVVHFHGFDAHRNDYVARYGNYAEMFRYASALVVVSRAMEQRLLELGADREKVIYNCYGIDVDRFVPGRPDQAPPHFLAIGRFADEEGAAPDHRSVQPGRGPAAGGETHHGGAGEALGTVQVLVQGGLQNSGPLWREAACGDRGTVPS